MNSILNNSAALSALQALSMTQQSLATTQSQVSTGLAVGSAADNAAYWSIAQHLGASSGMVTAANSAMSQSQAILDTANTAIKSVITTINSIQKALTEATNPGADLTNIGTTLSSLGQQLSDAVTGASFNGSNILDGSQGTGTAASVSFVSGFNAASGVNNVTTINMGVTTVLGATTYSGGTASSGAGTGSAGTGILGTATGTFLSGSTITSGTSGSYDLTQLAYYGGSSASSTDVTAATLGTAVSSTAGFSTLNPNQIQDMLTAVNAALTSVTNYAATIGATQDRMTAMNNLNQALTTNYANGISGLVDADMNTASTRLQALQTQQQLGIQSLSIANQNAQLILKLFP